MFVFILFSTEENLVSFLCCCFAKVLPSHFTVQGCSICTCPFRVVVRWRVCMALDFNITIVQAYAPTSDYDDNEKEEFSDQLQNVIDQTPKKDVLVVQGDWNAKVGTDACGNWQGICGPFCNDDTNERRLRHLEFATNNQFRCYYSPTHSTSIPIETADSQHKYYDEVRLGEGHGRQREE